ncbi:hypothetical protein [Metabacillus niabensis]|uniref:hypothetical protein n=1 Tax=Metabacillus niabensis TaxID=324854 RepID=UPI001CFB24A6|nr:hypothetical protein [Metabacillus niabensis]
MQELLSLEHFREVKSKGHGYIAITDKNLPKNCIHHTSCYEVKERYFNQKVITSNRKNGSYYYTEEPMLAIDKFEKMEKCQKCF